MLMSKFTQLKPCSKQRSPLCLPAFQIQAVAHFFLMLQGNSMLHSQQRLCLSHSTLHNVVKYIACKTGFTQIHFPNINTAPSQ